MKEYRGVGPLTRLQIKASNLAGTQEVLSFCNCFANLSASYKIDGRRKEIKTRRAQIPTSSNVHQAH